MSGSLDNSPSEVVQALVVDLGEGTDPADDDSWPVYVSAEPDSPDACITVYDTAGRIQGSSQIDGEVIETHGIQVRVRHAKHNTGYAKARAIAVALDAVEWATVAISTARYLVCSVTRTSDVIALGKEKPDSKRNLFTINAVASLRQTT